MDEQKFQEAVERLETKNTELAAQNARLQEAMLLRDAKDFVRAAVVAATVPDVTKARLVESLSANPPIKDGALDSDTYAARIAESIKAEVEYLTKAAGYGSGRVEGMGGQPVATEQKPEEIQAKMQEAFQRLGLSSDAAVIAAKGRGW